MIDCHGPPHFHRGVTRTSRHSHSPFNWNVGVRRSQISHHLAVKEEDGSWTVNKKPTHPNVKNITSCIKFLGSKVRQRVRGVMNTKPAKKSLNVRVHPRCGLDVPGLDSRRYKTLNIVNGMLLIGILTSDGVLRL